MLGTRNSERGTFLTLVALGAALFVAPLAAQKPANVSGRILRLTAKDTAGVPGLRVVLHRVGRAVQGPVDSTISGPRGEFRFRFIPDTAAVYLLSAGWQGIEYFSTPVHTDPSTPDTGLTVVVSDTSSTAPVDVLSRHLVVSRPGQAGSRSVLEIVVLANGGSATRVSSDSSHPTWVGGLPGGAVGFEAGSGDFSGDAVQFRGDSLLLFAPIAPGEKQLIYTYSIPAGSGPVKIAVPDSIAMFNILLEEPDLSVKGGQIAKADTQTIEGRRFRQWAGSAAAGSVVTIELPGKGLDAWILPVLVGLVAVALVLIAARVMARRPTPASLRSSALDQLAQLDARYAGKEASVPPEEWQQYQAERARLKQDVSAQLARTRPKA